MVIIMTGCRPRTQYIPVPTVSSHSVAADTSALLASVRSMIRTQSQKETTRDSAVDRSEQTVTVNERGDTVRLTRTRFVYVKSQREKDLELELSLRDSLIHILEAHITTLRSDSVATPVPVPVEQPSSFSDKITEIIRTTIVILFISGLLIFLASYLKYRLKNKLKNS